MAWCMKPSLSTLSNLPDRISSGRYLSIFASSWPSDPSAYEITRHIGNGSSASVYEAHCKQLQTTVAVKRMDLDAQGDLAALIREASLLRRFQHRHVLLLHTSFVVGRELWMVMPFMDLGSVRSIMRKAFPQGLDEVMIATIMKSTLQALEYVHRNGGIHRDIKADNILLNSTGEVRLADFGVAADPTHNMSFLLRKLHTAPQTDDSSGSNVGSSGSNGGSGSNGSDGSSGSSGSSGGGWGSTSREGCGCEGVGGWLEDRQAAALKASLLALRANTFVGTPCWMAPEVMQQLDEGYTNAADLWSVGITLIELATGTPPLARCHPMRVLADTLHCPPPSLPPDTPHRRYSKALRDLVAACLQKDASKRPTATQLLQHRFFRTARDASYLSTTLLSALLQAQHAQHSTADSADPAARAASLPQRPPASLQSDLQAACRKIHSEPLLSRLRSVLGLVPGVPGAGPGVGLVSFLGPRVGKLSLMQPSATAGNGRERSRWQFTAAAAAGLGFKPGGGLLNLGHGSAAFKEDAAAAAGPAGLAAAAAAAAGSVQHSAAVAGQIGVTSSRQKSDPAACSLSRSGSRGVKVSLPPSEAARYTWYAK